MSELLVSSALATISLKLSKDILSLRIFLSSFDDFKTGFNGLASQFMKSFERTTLVSKPSGTTSK